MHKTNKSIFKKCLAFALSAGMLMGNMPVNMIKAEADTTVITIPKPVVYTVKAKKAGDTGYVENYVVDSAGKKVDFEEISGTKNSLGNGNIYESLLIEENNDLSKASDAMELSGGGTAYTSPYVPKKVRNQGSWGTCWAHAGTAVIETNMIKNAASFGSIYDATNIDLSERHLAYFGYNTYTTDKTSLMYGEGSKQTTSKVFNNGGNDGITSAYLARGSGMAFESDAPYDITSAMQVLPEEDRNISGVQLKNYVDLGTYEKDASSVANGVTAIQAAIKQYGAVTARYESNDNYADSSDGRQNFYTKSTTGCNHEICVVGWDDNYSASEFKTTPPGNGAWLARNSWGDGWSKDGYFWISYYDNSLCGFSTFEVTPATTYGRTYSYTASRPNGYLGWNSKSVGQSNIYECQEDESLKSVGFYTVSNNIQVDVKVYVKDTAFEGSPVFGSAVASYSGTINIKGFHVVDLSKAVSLKKGQYFSIVVMMTSTQGNYVQLAYEGSGAKMKNGTTYFYNGYNWTASETCVSGKKKGFNNAYIYAYTSDTDNKEKLAELKALISKAKAIDKTDMAKNAGSELVEQLNLEIKRADQVVSTPQEDDLERELRMLKRRMSFASSKGMTLDKAGLNGPGADGIEIYANGGSVKVNGVTTNYKTSTQYVSMDRVASAVKSGKKYISKINGKYVATATSTPTKPELNEDGTFKSVDSEAMEKVALKMSGNKLTVTPKKAGDVYVWVLWYPICTKDYGYQVQKVAEQKDYAVTKVHIDTAPATLKLYYDDKSVQTETTKAAYTSSIIPPGGTADVYVTGSIGSVKAGNLTDVNDTTYIGYFSTIAAKYNDYVKVVQDQSNPRHFQISISEDILTAMKVKDGKTLTVPINIVCDKNGKKAVFNAVIGNPYSAVDVIKADVENNNISFAKASGIINIEMEDARAAAKYGFIEDKSSLTNLALKPTDTTKFVTMGTADYTFSATGTIVPVDAPGVAQKKVSIAAVKGSPGRYKITAAKGTPAGTEVYFMLYHNSYGRTMGKGYQIIKVKVGEANHYSTMTLAKDDTSVGTFKASGSNASINIDSANLAAKTFMITESNTLVDSKKEATDAVAIYSLPCGGKDGFTITKVGDVKVNGACTAAQKKITLAYIKGETPKYKVTAAKGTPEGTESYFLIYHNPSCYSVVSVTAGTPNKVTSITLKEESGKVTLGNITEAGAKVTQVSFDYSKTLAQSAVLEEKYTLSDNSSPKTDVNVLLRMRDVNAFNVALNKSTVTAVGKTTTAQNKITMTLTDKINMKYTIKVAKGTPIGTTTYFVIYHNSDEVNNVSGKGYQIVKVVVK